MARRKIGIDPDDLRDLIDLARLADRHTIAKRCPGGRYIAEGYVCGLCGEDPSLVIEEDGRRYRKCGAPHHRSTGRKALLEDALDVIPSL